eukprot:NODE_4907_length_440_cov_23.350384_g4247_i0.p2 GENE.NODE_4907_length_440_cov_23.350384_g4247_i0~~NODE_4907_length_440_cov_23.350384_g4247_i0.p2  ORF type:complete len:79 (-),score=18.02 NODE_4907_length_440_cov_23.350384_g4247_i0:149-385(-)
MMRGTNMSQILSDGAGGFSGGTYVGTQLMLPERNGKDWGWDWPDISGGGGLPEWPKDVQVADFTDVIQNDSLLFQDAM